MESNWVDEYFDTELQAHQAVVDPTREALRAPFAELIAAAVKTIQGGGKILFFGNGGSAADAQHLATELTIRYQKDRAPIAAIALTTDSSALTAGGNDLGFDQIFARQIEALACKGDLAIGISTSGTSPNVLLGLEAARAKGCVTAGFAGKGGGSMADHCDILLTVPSETTSRIQEMHITLGHCLCGALERALGLVTEGQ